MTVGETIQCTIEKCVYGGMGLSRVEGCVVFVPGVLPGEVVDAKVEQMKKSFCRASLVGVVKRSPDRIDPDCELPGGIQVPGCCYDIVAYPVEVRIKQGQLEEAIARLPSADKAKRLEPVAASQPLHYRNKISLHGARPRGGAASLGYMREFSHRVVDLPQCPLATEPINKAIEEFRKSDAWRTVRDGTDVVFREISPTKAGWWSRQVAGGTLPSILIEDTACGPLRVPRNAFFQVNTSMASKLIGTVCDWFKEGAAETPEIIDGYCGVGVLGLSCMKHGGERLVGIESSRSSVEAARQNARMWEVKAEFRCVALGEEPFTIKSCIGNRAKTALFLDPPRGGMSQNWTEQVVKSGIPRIFYVSCDPATLARDLRILVDGGYELKRVQLLDLFPRTARFETVTELHIVE